MGFLQANYDKPGAGVRKDAPQKKEFVLFFEIYVRKFWKLILANLLYILFSLPILTCGLADAGLTYITRNFAREKSVFLWEDFTETIKKNWKQALPIGIINLAISALLLFDIQFFYASGEGVSGVIMLALMFFVSLVFIFMRYYIPFLIITFKLSIKQIYKNSFLLALAGMKRNIVISLVLAILYGLAYALLRINLVVGLAVLILAYMFLFPAFRSFLIQFCIFPVVKKHMIDPYYRDHPDEDIDKRKDLNLDTNDGEEDTEDTIFQDTIPMEEEESSAPTGIPRQYTRPDDNDDDTI